VYVTAGGITQKREQNAGIHKNTQNHARLHFGLAQNTTIDTIKVLWPSGKISILNNVGADQIMRIQE
ncbi:MAG: ASPIC/UnbV domain-containing protein, partial [Flavobacteriales bacterium]|nr:ASPIC/UnbV domain-containing protein [Flavobacteriales bacterium]